MKVSAKSHDCFLCDDNNRETSGYPESAFTTEHDVAIEVFVVLARFTRQIVDSSFPGTSCKRDGSFHDDMYQRNVLVSVHRRG